MKRSFVISLIIAILFTLNIDALAKNIYYNNTYHVYEAEPISLYVNNKKITSLPMDPIILDGRTMVPIREVFEAMGSTVKWHSETNQAEIVNGKNSILVKIGSRNTYFNGNLIKIDSDQPYPMLIGYSQAVVKTMVPVRFIAEQLNYNVKWDEDTRSVYISQKTTSADTGDKEVMEDGYGEFNGITVDSDNDYDYIYITTKHGISPKILRYTNPERIVLDFEDAKIKSVGGTLNLNGNCVSTVRFANHETQARIVLDMTDKNAQVMVLSTDDGMLIRVEKSKNTQIVYDAFSKKIYFNSQYTGKGQAVNNGYKVELSNLLMSNQNITINDDYINTIKIESTSSGCIVTVSGNSAMTYSKTDGISISNDNNNTDVEEDTENDAPINDGVPTIVIDAGHGGTDPGAVGYNSKNEIVARESKINLSIANIVKDKLETLGYNVIMTRSKDTYVSLSDRVAIANDYECDLFVSIHCNSIENSSINGTQVYYHPVSEIGSELANNIYNLILKNTDLEPKGTQNGSHLYVIRTTSSPAVLVETAFISNESDRNYLLSTSGQNALANSIVEGITKTLKEM